MAPRLFKKKILLLLLLYVCINFNNFILENYILFPFNTYTHKLFHNIFTNCFDSKFLLVWIWVQVQHSYNFFYLPVTTYHISNL